jgi:hypothetical protein
MFCSFDTRSAAVTLMSYLIHVAHLFREVEWFVFTSKVFGSESKKFKYKLVTLAYFKLELYFLVYAWTKTHRYRLWSPINFKEMRPFRQTASCLQVVSRKSDRCHYWIEWRSFAECDVTYFVVPAMSNYPPVGKTGFAQAQMYRILLRGIMICVENPLR